MGSEKEFDWNQYNNLSSQKSNTENQMDYIEGRNQELSQQIEILKQAKSIVSDGKEDFNNIKKTARECVDNGYEWKGNKYDTFLNNGSDLKGDNDSYYNSIDNALDRINDKITELENEIYENEGFLGSLKICWNNLCNAIENLFN